MLENQICVVCQQKSKYGLHILNKYICETCEREIVESHSGQIQYGYFVWKLRNLMNPPDREQELHG